MNTTSSGKARDRWPLHPGWQLALLLFASLGAPRLAAQEQKKGEFQRDLEKLRGTWVVKSNFADGKQVQDTYTYKFAERTYTMEWPPGPLETEPSKLHYDFELDSTGQFKVIWEMGLGKG